MWGLGSEGKGTGHGRDRAGHRSLLLQSLLQALSERSICESKLFNVGMRLFAGDNG